MNGPGQAELRIDLLSSNRVAILGLGLMGGSLALALRGGCAQLLGYDPDPQAVRVAQTNQMVDYASKQIDKILPQADLIILAAPVKQILRLLGELDQLHPGPAVVLDIGSTKRQVVAAMQALPARFDPLGGHPMCGKEKSSLTNAEPDLYQGAAFVLCRLTRTSQRALQLADQLIHAVGAHTIWLEAELHDRWIAATSHLPYLLANALVQATPLEAAGLVGPGYRSTTRLAASFTPMLLDVLDTNLDMLLPALHTFREVLDRLEGCLIKEDREGLEVYLQESAQRHANLLDELKFNSVSGGKSG